MKHLTKYQTVKNACLECEMTEYSNNVKRVVYTFIQHTGREKNERSGNTWVWYNKKKKIMNVKEMNNIKEHHIIC